MKRAIVSTLVLTVLALAQFAILAVPAGLALAARKPHGAALWQALQSWQTLLACLVAVLAALLLGTPAALALWRRQGWGMVAGLLLAPLLVQSWLMRNGLLGHASLGLGFGTACVLIGLAAVEPEMLRAAALCGLSPWRVYRRLVLPVAFPSVLAGLLLTATASLSASLAASLEALPPADSAGMALAPTLAGAGLALLLCAVTGAALLLLRRA
jgi:ABC-type spermidine/putrescine transport system permease subunit II